MASSRGELREMLESAVRPAVRIEMLWDALRHDVDAPASCVEIAGVAVDAALAVKDLDLLVEGRLQRALANIRLERAEAALGDLSDLATSYSLAGRGDAELAGIHYLMGELRGRAGDPLVAMEDLERARACALRAGKPAIVRASLYARGRMLMRIGANEEALRTLLDAAGTGDDRAHDLGDIYRAIGEVHGLMGQHENAIRYLNRSIDAYRETSNLPGESSALAAIAQVESLVGNSDAARASAERALSTLSALGMSGDLANSMLLLATTYEKLDDTSTALVLLRQLINLPELDAEGPIRIRAVMALARIQARSDAEGEARMAIDYACLLAEKLGDPALLMEIFRIRSDIYEQLRFYAQALEYFKRYSLLKEQIAGEEMRKTIAALQRKFDYDLAQQEADRFRSAVLEKEKALQERVADLLAKSELIEEVSRSLRKVSAGGAQGLEPVSSVLQRIETARSSDRTWYFVREDVETIHPGFTQKLLERCPALTRAEVEVCMLARLKLSSKEIAASRGSSSRTIEKHIQNVRDKLGLGIDVKLWHVLASL